MKKIFLLCSAIIAGIIISAFTSHQQCSGTGGNITSIEIGTTLPKGDVKLKDISGKEITLKDCKKENGLLVVFSCNTCPFVIKHQAAIKDMGKQTKDCKVGYVIINSNEAKRDGDDSFDAMKKYAESQGYDFPYTVDVNSALADAFGATRTPEAFLFDKNLKLVYKGAYTDDSDPANATKFFLKDAVNALRDGKPVPVSSAKSVGCGIKRKMS
jgi:cytochrome oxidase Cu insertion factor (SCO1/SenC/PrrC family)